MSTEPSDIISMPFAALPPASWSFGKTSTVTTPPEASSTRSLNLLATRVSICVSVPFTAMANLMLL